MRQNHVSARPGGIAGVRTSLSARNVVSESTGIDISPPLTHVPAGGMTGNSRGARIWLYCSDQMLRTVFRLAQNLSSCCSDVDMTVLVGITFDRDLEASVRTQFCMPVG